MYTWLKQIFMTHGFCCFSPYALRKFEASVVNYEHISAPGRDNCSIPLPIVINGCTWVYVMLVDYFAAV